MTVATQAASRSPRSRRAAPCCTASSRLLPSSVCGAVISVAGDLSPSLLDAHGPSRPAVDPAADDGRPGRAGVRGGLERRLVALIGSGLLAAALLAGVISGFFDGGYADDRLTAFERAYQVTFVGALAVVGVVAARRFWQVLRSTSG